MRGITLGVLSQGEMFQTYIDRVNGDGGQVKDMSLMYPFVSKLGSLGFSLITVPSAIKSGKLYSVFPADGSGDFIVNRNGEATYFDKDGVLRTAGANVPRVQYNSGTKAYGGLLIEPQRTNYVTFSNKMQSLNTADVVVLTGQPDSLGGNSGVMFEGPKASPLVYHFVASHPILTTTFSFKKHLSQSVILLLRNNSTSTNLNNASFNFSGSSLPFISNGWEVRESNNGYYTAKLTFSGDHSVGDILRVYLGKTSAWTHLDGYIFDWYQVEEGSNPTSLILTQDSQVTRPADQVSLSDLQGKGFLSPLEGTVFLHKDGDKIADIYQGGNKATYKNGILKGTVSAPVPTSYLLETGIYKAVGMKNQALTAGQATELTSNGLLP